MRHGKSELSSRWTPAWFLENWPDKQVALASYEATWAVNKFGRWVRNLIEANERHLSVRLAKDLTGAGEWMTTREGGMFTTGVGGPLTGRGVHLMLIDDPIKNREEANSKLHRNKIWEWWEDAADTRIEPDGAAIILMARWHVDDIVGRIKSGQYISDDDGDVEEFEVDEWKVLNLPAIAKNADDAMGREIGEPLWPDKWSKKKLMNKKRGRAQRWASLYQQDPRPEEGNMVDRSWFKLVKDYPREARIGRFWDLAGTEKTSGNEPDWTVGTLIAELRGEYWIVDRVKFRATPAQTRRKIQDTAKRDGRMVPIYMWQDPAQAGKDQISSYSRDVLPGYIFHGVTISGNKITLFEAVSSSAENGNVNIVEGDWNKDWLDSIENFPNDVHDDDADSASLGWKVLHSDVIPVEDNVPHLTAVEDNYWLVA